MLQWNVSEIGKEFEAWYVRLATKPLPGGVAAAAVAASLGSGLVAKVCRLTLAAGSLGDQVYGSVESVLDLAHQQGAALMALAREDEQAYQEVLTTRRLREPTPKQRQAWQEATESPLQLAERCGELLDSVPTLFEIGLPTVRVDLAAGCWLLEVGLRTGLEAAESNLRQAGAQLESLSFRSRVDNLRARRMEQLGSVG
jgi:formiminotetrahydrofolate cyclodeaminase